MTERLKHVYGTNHTLSSYVDQDTYEKVTETQENIKHKRPKRPALSQQMTIRVQITDKQHHKDKNNFL